MNHYLISEGSLSFAEDFIDESIHILKFPAQAASLVITRALLDDKQNAESYIAKQMAALKINMPDFTAGERTVTELGCESDNIKALTAVEIPLQFTKNGTPIYQILLSTQLPNTNKLLVLTYGKTEPLSENDKAFWQALKASFNLAASQDNYSH